MELYFASDTSLTYTGEKADGSHGGSETVAITITPVRDGLFLVTWQEADKTTVVHLEDYKLNRITTNITDADRVCADRRCGQYFQHDARIAPRPGRSAGSHVSITVARRRPCEWSALQHAP